MFTVDDKRFLGSCCPVLSEHGTYHVTSAVNFFRLFLLFVLEDDSTT